MRVALVVVAVIAAAAALRTAAIVVIPVVLAVWLALLLYPFHRLLKRVMPCWIAAVLSVASLFIALLLFGLWGWYAVDSAVDHTQANLADYRSSYHEVRTWLESNGVPDSWLPDWTDGEGGPDADATIGAETARADDETRTASGEGAETRTSTGRVYVDPAWASPNHEGFLADRREELVVWLSGGLRSTLAIGAAGLLVVAFCFLALLEFHRWRDWSHRIMGRGATEHVHALSKDCSSIIRRYFVAKFITGLVSGVATGLFLWLMGVPLPIVWGTFTFLMNFIPNIGALISGLPPTLLALLELGLWQAAVVVAGLIVIETFVGNVLDPLIQGDALDLSPFVVLASLLFWGWLWGIVGAILAPTLTASLYALYKRIYDGPRDGPDDDDGDARARPASDAPSSPPGNRSVPSG